VVVSYNDDGNDSNNGQNSSYDNDSYNPGLSNGWVLHYNKLSHGLEHSVTESDHKGATRVLSNTREGW